MKFLYENKIKISTANIIERHIFPAVGHSLIVEKINHSTS